LVTPLECRKISTNAEPKRLMSDFWRQWENQVIGERFPLRRFLGESSHSAVFLTEYESVDAAIKFIRDDPSLADMQLERWQAAAALSHPHLIRLFETGRCRLGNHELLFVVMEYAEQTLAQILTLRALTFDEVRQMSGPALEALSFLHRNGWVHGQVKPPNICVVNDELKLASDTLSRAGERLAGSVDTSPFKAPEEKGGGASAAGDIWGIGMTLVAALNQQPPPDGPSRPAFISSTVPPAFADAVARCLSLDVARRPTAADLRAQLTAADPDPPASLHQANVETEPPPTVAARTTRRGISRARVVGGIVLLMGAVWGGARLMHGPAGLEPAHDSHAAAEPASSRPVAGPAHRPLPQVAVPSDPVLHKEIPVVSHTALRSIRGRIQVLVTVTVDASGNVIDETLEHSGSSKYFARTAAAAARKWRFAPAAGPGTRKWLLRFEFARAGTAANAAPTS
jgi:TonB family protein